MSEVFDLHAPEKAKAYLEGFDRAVRSKGEDYFRRGCVGEMVCQEPGRRYLVAVRGTLPYEVELFYDDDTEGWRGDCT